MIRWNAARRRIPLFKRLIPSLNRAWARLVWRHDVRTIGFRGALWLLAHRNRVDREIAFYGDYEDAQLSRFLARLGHGDVDLVLDIGANFGLYAILAAVHSPVERIIAFEPDARNRDQLATQRWLNPKARRVEIDPRAVSAASGEVIFQSYPDTSTGQSRIADTGEAVTAVALDEIFDLAQRRIMIKIDVEGHELAVLTGARRLLSQNQCWLQVEIWPAQRAAAEAFLSELGYYAAAATGDDQVFIRKGDILQ